MNIPNGPEQSASHKRGHTENKTRARSTPGGGAIMMLGYFPFLCRKIKPSPFFGMAAPALLWADHLIVQNSVNLYILFPHGYFLFD